MKLFTLTDELKNNGYSQEERYFNDLHFKNISKLVEKQKETSLEQAANTRMRESAIERWETDGGFV